MAHPAYVLARVAGRLSRGLGRGGGTSLPGHLLLARRPDAIRELRSAIPGGAVTVSATNGKTTTARLIAACLRAGDRPIVSNPSGANLASGVATALLAAPRRPAAATTGLFEVDEAALPHVVAQLEPGVIVLMNLFRDQLDRYGELEVLAERWREMLASVPDDTIAVLNADDPAIAALGDGRPGTLYFGLDDPGPALDELPHAADSKRCRRCEAPLVYDRVYLGHLGHWHCASCGWSRPTPTVSATSVSIDGLAGLDVTIQTPAGSLTSRISLPGLHNAYNATAAVAAATAMGIAPDLVGEALRSSQAAFGRAERIRVAGRDTVLLLIKNPAGANETIRTVLLDPEPLDVLAVLNDRTADGRDVSWIWDVDYEPLLPRLRHLTVSGDRAYDLALRFRYAGLERERLSVIPDPERALDSAVSTGSAERPLYILPTYTAMLGLREVLVRRGEAQEFWRDR